MTENNETYLQRNHGVALDHPRRCTARRVDGEPCRRFAIKGGTVCRTHGGAAPQVVAKAKVRLQNAADLMARELLNLVTGAESEAVKLAAIRDALDRAGVSAKQEVSVELKPFEQMLGDFATVSRARQAALERGDVIDAEVVDSEPAAPAEAEPLQPGVAPGASGRSRSRVAADDAEAPVAPPERAPRGAEPPAAPPWAEPAPQHGRAALTDEEDAVADTARANAGANAQAKRDRKHRKKT